MYENSKSTSRFTFGVSRNSTSHKAGANIVTIATRPSIADSYSTSTVGLTMTVKEALALQSFLNTELDYSSDADVDDADAVSI